MSERSNSRCVVHVNNFAGPGLGGGERYLIAQASAAMKAGWKVTIVCLPGTDLSRAVRGLGLEAVELPLMSPAVPLTVLRLRRVFSAKGANVVHTHGFFVNQVGRLAARLARVSAVVSTVHCRPDSPLSFDRGVLPRLSVRAREAIDRFTSRWADAIEAVSEDIARGLAEAGVRAPKIEVVYNGVCPREVEREAMRPLDFSPPEGALIGTVGRVERVKGLEYFVEAARRVAGEVPSARFLIVGEGPDRDRIERLIARSGLGGKVLITGYLPSALALLARLDVYALSSLSEGLNTSLLEALVLRRPVVATAVGGTPEVILDERTGLLVPPADPAALAGSILRLLQRPDEAARLAESGRERVASRFRLREQARKNLQIYEAVLRRKSEGR
ncbi:MAG: glycosyltransferase family 1 protein [Actinobacteria bacterium]|nr:MAG: glycosyltransferase family 1 protein [Actinomycetota bacterium]